MSAKEFWDAVAAGKPMRITLQGSSRRRPTRTRIVRAAPFSHYEGFDPRTGGRPRCRARGCGCYLRADQRFACSPECEAIVRDELRALQEAVGVAA